MKNKYLDEISVDYKESHLKFPYNIGEFIKNIPREFENFKQRRVYGGCCSKDCWNLDAESIVWLYCHLKRYLEDADRIVNLDYHKFDWNGKEYTQKEAINYIIDKLENYLIHHDEISDEHCMLLDEKYGGLLNGCPTNLNEEKEKRLSYLTNKSIENDRMLESEVQDAIKLYSEIIFTCWW